MDIDEDRETTGSTGEWQGKVAFCGRWLFFGGNSAGLSVSLKCAPQDMRK